MEFTHWRTIEAYRISGRFAARIRDDPLFARNPQPVQMPIDKSAIDPGERQRQQDR